MAVQISKELLMKTNTGSIYHENLQFLAIEMFKTQKNLSPSFKKKIFEKKDNPCTLRSGRNILAPKSSMTGYGIEYAHFLGGEIWHTMTSSLKESQTLNSFKRGIKNHQLDCNFRSCKQFAENLGFL